MLLRWGDAVHSRWKLDNVLNVDSSADLKPVLTALQIELIGVKAENEKLHAQINAMQQEDARRHNELLARLDALPGLLASAAHIQSPSSAGSEPFVTKSAAMDTTPVQDQKRLCVDVSRPPVSALTALAPPPHVTNIETTCTLYELYSVWYERGFTTVNTPPLWWCKAKQDRSRVKTVINYTESLLPAHIREVFQQRPPIVSSALYQTWKVHFTAECSNLVKHVIDTLRAIDGKKTQGAPTVNSVDTRLKDKKYFQKNSA